MILRRIVGLIILALIIIIGLVLYFVLRKKISYVESDLTVVRKKDIKGQ
jgi:hypothetical protein